MTVAIGVLCSDGVVIGADSSATFTHGNYKTIEQPSEKIRIIGDSIILTGSGSVGLAQRFERIVENAFNNGWFNNGDHHIELAKKLYQQEIADLKHTNLGPGQYAALLGFHSEDGPMLYEFPIGDFQPEFKDKGIWYVSMGSGQPIVDPFLGLMRSVFWIGGMPTVNEATFVVTWALDHAIEVNAGGINGPIRIAVLEKTEGGQEFAARILEDSELESHKDHIRSLKSKMRDHLNLSSWIQALAMPGAEAGIEGIIGPAHHDSYSVLPPSPEEPSEPEDP